MSSPDGFRKAIGSVVEPITGKTLDDLRAVKEAAVSETKTQLCIKLRFGFPQKNAEREIRRRLLAKVKELGFESLDLHVESGIVAHRVKLGLKPLKGVKNILAVGSAKGGVGKSTVALGLALALSRQGARVGLLDADIYGPSVPILLGAREKPEISDGKAMLPVAAHGLQVNSIGFFVSEKEPLAWRGPMASNAIRELAEKTQWQDLDYLVVDLPPGTGDIQLTLAQSIPVTAAVVVTTPQTLACADAARGLRLFEKVGIPVVGLVENMAYYKCPDCGRVERIFGSGGAEQLAESFGVPIVGSLPIAPAVSGCCDVTEANASSDFVQEMEKAALRVAVSVSAMPRDMTSVMPSVKVEPLDGSQDRT